MMAPMAGDAARSAAPFAGIPRWLVLYLLLAVLDVATICVSLVL